MYGLELEDLYFVQNKKIEEDNKLSLKNYNTSSILDNESKEWIASKKEFSTIEISIFALCPKMYYHLFVNEGSKSLCFNNHFQLKFYAEGVLYNYIIKKLLEYSQVKEKIYSFHDDELYMVFKGILQRYQAKILDKFNFLSEFEKKDIRINLLEKFNNFLCFLTEYSGFNYNLFKIDYGENIELLLDNGIKVKNNNDFKIVSADDDSSFLQFSVYYYLYFLVLKNRDEHFSLILRDLKWWDRFAISYIEINKTKIKKLISKLGNTTEFKPKSSDFCRYCLLNNICKEYHLFEDDDHGY